MSDQQNTNAESTVFIEEAFVVEVQSLLQTVMNEQGFSRADLAAALGVSRARISQIFSDECKNLTIRFLARAVAVMGDRVELTSNSYRAARKSHQAEVTLDAISKSSNVHPCWELSGPRDKNPDSGMDVAAGGFESRTIAGTLRRREQSLKQAA